MPEQIPVTRPVGRNSGSAVKRRPMELAVVLLFVVVQLVAPWLIGEVYPFTVSPMFSDRPRQCALYRVEDADGRELPLEEFGLHLVYDGNPPGFGVGIVPCPTLHAFGVVPDRGVVVQHVRGVLRSNPRLPDRVVVRQEVRCGGASGLEIREDSWTVTRDGEPNE